MPPKDLPRRTRRKKQTRLVFDPVGSSTTAAPASFASATNSPYSPAKVRYSLAASSLQQTSLRRSSGSPAKMGSLGKAKGKGKGSGQEKLSWPTPAKSQQGVGSAPVMAFTSSAATASDADASDSDIVPPSSRRNRHSSPPQSSSQPRRDTDMADMVPRISTRSTKPKALKIDADSSDGSAPEEELFDNSKKKRSAKMKEKKAFKTISISSDEEEADDSEDHEEVQLPVRRSTRSFIQGGSSYAAPISTPKSSYKTAKSSSASNKRRQKSVTLSSDDDMDELAISPPKKVMRTSARKRGKHVAEDGQSSEDEQDEDDVVITSSGRPRIPALPADVDETESEEIVSPLKRRRQPSAEEESDLEMERASPTKRQRGNVPETPSRMTRQARPRRRTEKEKTMELLRRKRAGEKIDQLTDSESEQEEQGGIYDTDSSLQALSEFEDEPETEAPTEKRKGKSRSEVVSEDEDSWIVGDDEDNIGVPLGLNDIPLEFTHRAHKPLKEHFKDAVEWMVHNKINPAFARDDDVYKIAFQKLDDEVRGYANSKFVSSAWTEGFNKAIWARPILMERDIDSAGVEAKCGACNRSGHPPKFAVQFQGKAYSRTTLEEIDQGSDSSSDSDSDSDSASSKAGSVNSKGQTIPSEETEWFVGRFCMANARTAHSLIHWKYALNEWVQGNLEGEDYLTPAALAARDKMKTKQRKKLANHIVDSWTAAGTVKSLYGDFKRSLEAARNGKQERWGK